MPARYCIQNLLRLLEHFSVFDLQDFFPPSRRLHFSVCADALSCHWGIFCCAIIYSGETLSPYQSEHRVPGIEVHPLDLTP